MNDIVAQVTSNKKMWIEVMMKEELGLSNEILSPSKSSLVVGISSLVGSIIPLIPFFFLSIKNSIYLSLIISAITLFVAGAVEGKMTIGHWLKKGVQLAVIGMCAAGIGFLIGKMLGVA